jgi:hypothetical protein
MAVSVLSCREKPLIAHRMLDHTQKDCVTILLCHCERPKGAWQSLYFRCIMRLLRSFHSLAMTLRHSLVVSGKIFCRILTRCSGSGRLINLVDQRQRIIAAFCFLVIAFMMRFHYNTGFPLNRRKLRRDLRQGGGQGSIG